MSHPFSSATLRSEIDAAIGEGTQPENCVQWPYSRVEYLKRVLWRSVYLTAWKLCWRRLYPLRPAILRCFGAKLNLAMSLSHSTWIERPWDFSVGKYTSIGPGTKIYNLGGVSIGERTIISQDVYVCGGTHDYSDPTYPLIRSRITIGSHVWIAAGAFIGPGVTIGEGAVVGARAVVVKDVEPWTVVAGNPAKVIRRRILRST